MAIEILEQCEVSPSAGSPSEHLLPLLHSDIIFLDSPLSETLVFYNCNSSESHFIGTVVPNLMKSLSLSLSHFLPLAGKIVLPLTSGTPVSHYVNGDSVSLTIATSNADFLHLTGNHPRDCDAFYELVAQMPPPAIYPSHGLIKLPVVALRATLFPNQGICIGLTNHHAIGDGATIVRWFQAWASINKFNAHLSEKFLPSYDRRSIQNAHQLTSIYWNAMKTCMPTVSSTLSLPSYKVRRTFVLNAPDIDRLKNFVIERRPLMLHASSFVVVCAFMWSCFTKAAAAAGEEVADDESEYFCCGAEYRAKLSPPLPANYFGNCVALVLAESSRSALGGEEGFLTAAQAIGEAINDDRGVDCLKEKRKLNGKRVFSVGGFPRYDLYAADYGWGKPTKFEFVSSDSDGPVFLCKSKGGGVEFGLSMPKPRMDAFTAIFDQALKEAAHNIFMINCSL